jgi:filamentous hemagglutinin
LNIDRATTFTRLGDGYFEALLVSQEVQKLTGQVQFDGFGSVLDQYLGLLQNAVDQQAGLGLQLGIALTEAQVAALTEPMLWYVSVQVDGRDVLVPVLYLSASDQKVIANGALITGTNVLIDATQITNSGTISATQLVGLTSGGDVVNAMGGIITGGTVIANAARDVLLQGGSTIAANGNGTFTLPGGQTITGGLVSLSAGNDIIGTAVVSTSTTVIGGNGNRTYAQGEQVNGATITSTAGAQFLAGNDINLNAATLTSGGATQLLAGNDITLRGTTSTTSTWINSHAGVNNWTYTADSATTFTGTTITSDGPVTVGALGGSLAMTGSSIQTATPAAGNITLFGQQGISIVAGESASSGLAYDQLGKKASVTTTTTALIHDIVGIDAAGDLNITTPGAFTVDGGTLVSGGALTVDAGSTSVSGVIDTQTSDVATWKKKSGFLSSTTTTTHTVTSDQTVVGSTLSGNSVAMASAGNTTILGSNVVASNGLAIQAGGDLTIGTLAATDTLHQTVSVKKSGISFGGGGLFIGSAKTTTTVDSTSVTHLGSLVGTVNGDATLIAGDKLSVIGSQIVAGGDVLLEGKSIDIANALDTVDTTRTTKSSSWGFSIGGQSQVIQSAANLVDAAAIATSTGNDRVAAVAGLAGGMAAVNAYNAGKDLASTIAKGKGDLGVSVGVSFGFSKSSSTDKSHDETVVGSGITGNNVTLLANGADDQGSIDVTGSNIAARNDLTLAANGPISIVAAQENDSQSGSAKSSGFNIGVSIDLNLGKKGKLGNSGVNVSVGASSSKSNYSGTDVTNIESTLTAGGTTTIVTPGALTIDGSTVAGDKVMVDAGSLAIASRQDTSTYNSSSHSTSVGASLNLATGQASVSGNVSNGKQKGDFASVAEQAGIYAGSGGFDIDVAGNTDLKGAVIASTADPLKNSLTTGTLTASNIWNRESWSASQTSLGGGIGGIGANRKGEANAKGATPLGGVKVAGLGTVSAALPVALSAGGNQNGTTSSVIAPGAIDITSGDAASQQVADTISRDTASANAGAITQEFTDAKREEVAQGFKAAQILTTETSVFLAEQGKKADAWTAANPDADPKDNPYTTWTAGGTGQLVLSALSGAAGSNVTGSLGSFAQSAVVNVLQGMATQGIKDLVDSVGGDPAARAALQAITGCAGSAAGGSGDCGSAAMGAAVSVVLNELLKTGTTTYTDENGNPLSADQQQARDNLVSTIVGAIAQASGLDVNSAVTASRIETENNSVKYVVINRKYVPVCETNNQGCSDRTVQQTMQEYDKGSPQRVTVDAIIDMFETSDPNEVAYYYNLFAGAIAAGSNPTPAQMVQAKTEFAAAQQQAANSVFSQQASSDAAASDITTNFSYSYAAAQTQIGNDPRYLLWKAQEDVRTAVLNRYIADEQFKAELGIGSIVLVPATLAVGVIVLPVAAEAAAATSASLAGRSVVSGVGNAVLGKVTALETGTNYGFKDATIDFGVGAVLGTVPLGATVGTVKVGAVVNNPFVSVPVAGGVSDILNQYITTESVNLKQMILNTATGGAFHINLQEGK